MPSPVKLIRLDASSFRNKTQMLHKNFNVVLKIEETLKLYKKLYMYVQT